MILPDQAPAFLALWGAVDGPPAVGLALFLLVSLAALVVLAGIGRPDERPTLLPAESMEFLTSSPGDPEKRFRCSAQWLISMRWWVAAATLLLVFSMGPIAGLLPPTSLVPLLAWWALLVTGNLIFRRWAARGRRPDRQIVAQALVDLIILTGLLNASGGIENPFFLAYVVYPIAPVFLLPRRAALGVTFLAAALFSGLVVGETMGILPHTDNFLFPHGAAETGGVLMQQAASVPQNLLFVAGQGIPVLMAIFLTSLATMTISARLRRFERELQHRRLGDLLDTPQLGMILLSPDRRVRWFNRNIVEWFHWRSGVLDSRCPLAGPGGPCTDGCHVKDAIRTGKSVTTERSVVDNDGRTRYFRFTVSPVRDNEGQCVEAMELVEEITAEKALQAEALHSAKLSSVGRLAAGLVHEIGNPLTALNNRLRRLENDRDPEFLEASLGVLRTEIGSMQRLVRDTARFSKKRDAVKELIDLSVLLDEAIELVRFDQRAERIVFHRDLDARPPLVLGVRDQLSQVFVNILLNAMDAMDGKGSMTISVKDRNGSVQTSISDTGRGIDETARERLFQPFFTTKEQGTGIGLTLCRELIRSHNGRIVVNSEPGKGACFMVELPAFQQCRQDTHEESLQYGPAHPAH